MSIERKKAPIHENRWTKEKTQKSGFVIHWTAAPMKSVNSSFKKNGETSYHIVVSDQTIYDYVDHDHIAHHAGNWEANKKNIGLALRGGYGDKKKPSQSTHRTAAKELARVANVLGIEKLVYKENVFRHSDVRDGGTECPGTTDIEYLIEKANNIIMTNDESLTKTMQRIAQEFLNVFGTVPAYRYLKFEADKVKKSEVDLVQIKKLWKDKSKDYHKHYANLWQYVLNHGGLRDKYKIENDKEVHEVVEKNYHDIVSHYIKHGIEEGVTDLIS